MRIRLLLIWTCTAFHVAPAAGEPVQRKPNATSLARCDARRQTACAVQNATRVQNGTTVHASFLARDKKQQSGGIVVEAHPKDAQTLRQQAAHIGYLQDCFDVPFEENYYVPEGQIQVKVNGNARDIPLEGDPAGALCEAIWYAGLMTANSNTACDGHLGFRQASCPEVCPTTDSMSGCN
jgi:hypothetical protein